MQKTLDNPLPAWHADAYRLIDRHEWRGLIRYACRDLRTSLRLLYRTYPPGDSFDAVESAAYDAIRPLLISGERHAVLLGEYLLALQEQGMLCPWELQAVADAVALMIEARGRGEQRAALDLFLASDSVANIVRRAIQE